MPFQPINYANIKPETYTSPDYVKQFIENLTNAYKVQQAPEEFQSSQALRQAQTQKLQEDRQKEEFIRNLITGGEGQQQGGMPNVSPEQIEAIRRNYLGISGQLPSEKEDIFQQHFQQQQNANAEADQRNFNRQKGLIDYRIDNAPAVNKGAQTKFVKQIADINSTLPMLDALKTSAASHPLTLDREQWKRYDNLIKLNKERILSSAAFPRIKQSYGDIDSALRRAFYESQKAYNARIDDIQNMLLGEYEAIPGEGWNKPALKYGSGNTPPPSGENIAAPPGTQPLKDKSGELHYIPDNLVEKFKKEMQ